MRRISTGVNWFESRSMTYTKKKKFAPLIANLYVTRNMASWNNNKKKKKNVETKKVVKVTTIWERTDAIKGKKKLNRIEINSEEAYANCWSVINCNLLIIVWPRKKFKITLAQYLQFLLTK